MTEFNCRKCEHKWESTKTLDDPPKVCPRCKSYNWLESHDDIVDRARQLLKARGFTEFIKEFAYHSRRDGNRLKPSEKKFVFDLLARKGEREVLVECGFHNQMKLRLYANIGKLLYLEYFKKDFVKILPDESRASEVAIVQTICCPKCHDTGYYTRTNRKTKTEERVCKKCKHIFTDKDIEAKEEVA